MYSIFRTIFITYNKYIIARCNRKCVGRENAYWSFDDSMIIAMQFTRILARIERRCNIIIIMFNRTHRRTKHKLRNLRRRFVRLHRSRKIDHRRFEIPCLQIWANLTKLWELIRKLCDRRTFFEALAFQDEQVYRLDKHVCRSKNLQKGSRLYRSRSICKA